MSSTPMEQPGQIGSGNDINMIESYGGPRENQQSSTMQGGSLSISTVPSDEINKNPETEIQSDPNKSSK